MTVILGSYGDIARVLNGHEGAQGPLLTEYSSNCLGYRVLGFRV